MKPSSAIRAIQQAFAVQRPLVFLILLVVCLASPVHGQVVINEIMADNSTTVANHAGLFSDWLELYNSGAATVNLGGYTLTDTPTNTTKYAIPANTLLAPGGRLIIWCDSTNGPGELHTGFSFKASGEFVGFYAATGMVDSVSFGVQITDLSIGRVPDGPAGAWTLTLPTPALPNVPRTLGSIAGLRINEWMATNSSGSDWIELYNPATDPVALAGLVFTTTLPPTIPTNAPMRALSFISAIGYIQFNCVGNKSVSKGTDLDFKLSHTSGETNTIYSHAGTSDPADVIDQIMFPGNNATGFYAPCNCSGNYWVPNVSYGRLPDGGTNIVLFAPSKTTPAASNFQSITNVLINEALSHTDPPLEDAIELYNPTGADVDISYWWLSNQIEDPKKFQIPAGTILRAFGYKVFYEMRGVTNVPHLGFNTSQTGDSPDFTLNSAHGDQIYLLTGDSSGNLTGYRRSTSFGSAENGVSFGRFTNSVGTVDFTAMSQRTFGTNTVVTSNDFRLGPGLPNAYPKVGPLVFTEIMYHPPDLLVGTNYVDNGVDEYLEVYNIATNRVYLYDTNGPFGGLYYDPRVSPNPFWASGLTNTWKLNGIVNFDFPTNISMAPGESLLLVNFDPVLDPTQLNIFRTKYGVAPNVKIFGPYSGGKLKNGGGTVELYKPDPPQSFDHPDFRYVPYILAEHVSYDNKSPWPPAADGGGYAIHRLVPERYGNEPTNWESALPTPGWQRTHIDSSQKIGNSFVLGFRALAGTPYDVQCKTNLDHSTNWIKLVTVGPLTNTTQQQITNSIVTNRLYRLLSPSPP